MPDLPAQTFQNHAKFDPPFHFFLAPVGAASVIIAIVHAYRNWSWLAGWMVVVAIAALIAVFRIRIYSLKVQDRVIRLEERLRLATVLPESLRSRIPELTESQLIALRFAPDGELPETVERALSGNWKQKEIKQAIRNWRADHFRI